jgi:MoaA/NifB/PqqE/SkfB family radical SAM enzyme
MKTTINLEINRKCNALCLTCPREKIKKMGEMKISTFKLFLERLDKFAENVSIVNLSGYGESIIHPKFFEIMELIRKFNSKRKKQGKKEVKFAMVTNGQGITLEKLKAIDKTLFRLKISFASIDKKNYKIIHKGLDYERVVSNIELAIKTLKKTIISLHLTPTRFTMDDIEPTVNYWRKKGIREIILFPFTFNRGGNLKIKGSHLDIDSERNLELARKLKLKQLEEVFVPSIFDVFGILFSKTTCLTKLAAIYIDYEGDYHHCINDISDEAVKRNLKEADIKEIFEENKKSNARICASCNMREGIDKKSLIKIIKNSIFSFK